MNEWTQMDIIDVEVDGRLRWLNVVVVVTVCTHNGNVDLTPARGSENLSALSQTSLKPSTTPSMSSSAKMQARSL